MPEHIEWCACSEAMEYNHPDCTCPIEDIAEIVIVPVSYEEYRTIRGYVSDCPDALECYNKYCEDPRFGEKNNPENIKQRVAN